MNFTQQNDGGLSYVHDPVHKKVQRHFRKGFLILLLLLIGILFIANRQLYVKNSTQHTNAKQTPTQTQKIAKDDTTFRELLQKTYITQEISSQGTIISVDADNKTITFEQVIDGKISTSKGTFSDDIVVYERPFDPQSTLKELSIIDLKKGMYISASGTKDMVITAIAVEPELSM